MKTFTLSSSDFDRASCTARNRDRWLIGVGIALILLAGGSLALALIPMSNAVATMIHIVCVVGCFGFFGSCFGLDPVRSRLVPFALLPACVLVAGILLVALTSERRALFSGLAFYSVSMAGIPFGLGFVWSRISSAGTAWATAALGLAAFAANGVLVFASLPLAVTFCVFAVFSLLRSPSPDSSRLLFAVTFAFAATWLGIAWNVERFSWVDYGRGYDAHAVWLTEHGASMEHYPTDVVTGFPIQAIEGHSGGGAPTRVLPGKGLGGLVANYVLWAVALAVLILKLSPRLLRPLTWLGVGLALASCAVGIKTLAVLLD